MRALLLAVLLDLFTGTLAAQQPTPDAATIMARVAANQDRTVAERAHFVYLQHARVASRKGKTVRCEEITDARVTPSADGSHQELLKLDGRLLVKGKYIVYTHLPAEKPGAPTVKSNHDDLTINIGDDTDDRDLVENMRANLTDRKSKDGFSEGLFPLTSKKQADYEFHLLGRESINGRPTFHIAFKPKDKSDYDWKGDAYIDAEAFQPVLIRTALSRNVPFAVRTLLGTSLPGLGFTVVYAPQPNGRPDGVWFPTSFGTEFKLHVLFFFNREITISAENRDFEQTHVTSTITPSQE